MSRFEARLARLEAAQPVLPSAEFLPASTLALDFADVVAASDPDSGHVRSPPVRLPLLVIVGEVVAALESIVLEAQPTDLQILLMLVCTVTGIERKAAALLVPPRSLIVWGLAGAHAIQYRLLPVLVGHAANDDGLSGLTGALDANDGIVWLRPPLKLNDVAGSDVIPIEQLWNL